MRPWKARSSATISCFAAPPTLAATPARELDAGLERLGARVAEEHAPEPGQRVQALGQRDRGLGPEQVRDVAEPEGLRRERGRRRGMAVAERADREPGDEVEVGRALLVPDGAAGAAHERERALGIGRQDRGLAAPDQRVGHARTSVPSRPIQTRSTPAESAVGAASSFGSMPPLALAGGADARSVGISAPCSSSTPGTSVRKTSSSAPSAPARAAAASSALTLRKPRRALLDRERPDHGNLAHGERLAHLLEIGADRLADEAELGDAARAHDPERQAAGAQAGRREIRAELRVDRAQTLVDTGERGRVGDAPATRVAAARGCARACAR